jgi:glycosyltransferase involved in cell wall biosynthesis
MKPAPVSVVIPVYNGERYLGDAIRSLLEQTLPVTEIVVVDDGSTDTSAEVAASFGDAVRLIQQANRGVAAARNRGIREANSSYVAWLDQDDLAAPNRIASQLRAFDATSPPDVVFGAMRQFISPEVSDDIRATLRCDDRPQPAPLPSCFMAPKRVFEIVGELAGNTDTTFVDWYLRANELGLKFHYVPELITLRRIHGANRSYRNEELRRDYLRTLKAALDRRRQQGRD